MVCFFERRVRGLQTTPSTAPDFLHIFSFSNHAMCRKGMGETAKRKSLKAKYISKIRIIVNNFLHSAFLIHNTLWQSFQFNKHSCHAFKLVQNIP